MKRFNKIKALNKIKNRNNYNIKRITIIAAIFILTGAIIYISFARFESGNTFNLINGTVIDEPIDVKIRRIYTDDTVADSLPAQGSGYDFDRIQCSNGATGVWDNNNWKLKLSLNSKTSCTLYFKTSFKLRGTTTDMLAQFTEDNTTTDIINKGWLNTFAYDGTADNNLRYVGANPKNYIEFNNELWRIIGIMNNIENSSGQSQSLLKIIRAESIGRYGWDSSVEYMSGGNYGNGATGINQWGESTFEDGTPYEGSDIMRELNTDYLGNITIGTDGKWYCDNAKSVDMPTTSLSSNAQSMMENVVWHLGSPTGDNGTYDSNYNENMTTGTSYTRERSNTLGKNCNTSNYHCTDTVVRTATWTGRVGLAYPSDLGFSTTGGKTINRNTCLNTSLSRWYSYDYFEDCRDNLWLKNTSYGIWSMSPYTDSYNADYGIYLTNLAYNSQLYYGKEIYPVVFLKSTVSITDGDGSSTNPYKIE